MTTSNNPVITYRRMRQAIGYLGMALPIVLLLASLFRNYVQLQHSISHYYYTNMREIFTGILCAVGLFLIRYKGWGNSKWWLNDNLLTNVAGAAAFGVALIPTNPDAGMDKGHTLIPSDWQYLGWFHYGFAVILFGSFAMLSLKVFTLWQQRSENVAKSILDENNIYRTCGILIFVFIILIPVTNKLFPGFHYWTILFESLSLLTFGTSWLVKGRALGDKGLIGEKLYGEHNS